MPLQDLETFVQHNIIPSNLPLPVTYLNSLDNDYKTIGLRACVLVFIASNRSKVPRQYQLEALNVTAHGLDCTIDSGTGSGKTLCQIILNLRSVVLHVCNLLVRAMWLKKEEADKTVALAAANTRAEGVDNSQSVK
jgi:superfamily II DNA/RNA helicase